MTNQTKIFTTILVGVMLLASVFLTAYNTVEMADETSIDERIYELRIYTTHPGKLDDLNERFSNHTLQLFAKHGMVNIGYWIPVDQQNTLIYVLSHESREAAEQSWNGFRNDPQWQRAYEESHEDGVIVSKIESIFMKAAPYSQIR